MHTLIPMSARDVLAAIHRGKNALVNVEGPHGEIVTADNGENTRKWKALATATVDGLLSCSVLAPWLTGEQTYFSLSSIYPAAWHRYQSEVTGLEVFSREQLQYLNCVCTDVDLAHDAGSRFDFDAQAQEILDFTVTAGLPFPSMLSNSGRGMWLFWLLKDRRYPEQPLGAFRNLQIIHSRILSATVTAYRKFNSGVDHSCTDSQRVARFPGSINSKSGTIAEYFRTSDQIFTLPEIASGFGVRAQKTIITERKAQALPCTGKPDCKCSGLRVSESCKELKPVCLTMRTQAALLRWRVPLSGLRKLAEIRGKFSKGHRRKAVYLFASIAKRARLQNLQAEAINFAGNHCPQLSFSEVRKCIAAARKNWRHISHSRIVDMLKITAPEQAQLTFWLKPATPSKAAAIEHRRTILAAEIALNGPLSIRKAMFSLSRRGITICRSQIAEDLKHIRAKGDGGAQTPRGLSLRSQPKTQKTESGFSCLSVSAESKTSTGTSIKNRTAAARRTQ